ncbi:Putative tartrate transporter [Paraburkholderia caffeinitolerans]|uniref:Tartrate transporter n=1 Tax=Paraburkholderia caffeinitolerans TaxID=1723730 RepID=A0A6J5GU50_9BURK|nr:MULTISPECIES: MFS transporter [Paraburkholderia]CAB3807069.1 Putative tartrate transporter [Paraburkholderia caffeinitolerans]
MTPNPTIHPGDTNSLYRKISRHIVPFVFTGFVIAFLDRINIGFAQLQMKSDLGFSDAVYGLGAGVFFLGYFICEVPSNLLLERIGARRTFMRIMIGWGIISSCMALVTTPWMLYVMRFLLGVFEAGFFPGIILYLTYWFPASRRASVTAWLFVAVAVAGVTGGILSGAIMQYAAGLHGLAGWQWMFILEGMPAVLMGFVVRFFLVDSPTDARWLTDHEKQFVERDLASDLALKAPAASQSVKGAFRNPMVYLFSAVYFTLTCGTMAISFWLPTIIHGAGIHSLLDTGLLSAIPYGIGAIGIILISRHSDKHRERHFHYAFCTIGGGIALFLIGLYGSDLYSALLFLSIAVVLTFAALPIFWSMPQDYLSGTGAAGGIALISSLGQLGSFFSPSLIGWIKTSTGRLDAGLYVLAALLIAGGIVVLIHSRKNVRRAAHIAA